MKRDVCTGRRGRVNNTFRYMGIVLSFLISLSFVGCTAIDKKEAGQDKTVASEENADLQENSEDGQMEQAMTTPFGRYPVQIEYTLGKMTGLNKSNMPEGDTYENNAYTRYLKQKLNIQNKNVFEVLENDHYSDTISMVVAAKKLPDVMLVDDISTLQLLVKEDMIEDLTTVYQQCASDRVKDIYASYGAAIFDNVMIDGRLMALPGTNIDNGPNFLWLREDWLKKLSIHCSDRILSLDEVEQIVQTFIEKDPGGNGKGKTVGLACTDELAGDGDYSSEYQLDIVFASENAYPKRWFQDEKGNISYGSVQPEVKKALAEIRRLYQSGVLDHDFLLRGNNNIIDMIVSGECGAFFGPWWAPNNPLMMAVEKDEEAEWGPYFVQTEKNGSASFASHNPSTKYIVVRKGYEHPEIVMKIVSVLFGEMKYGDSEVSEIVQYYQKNVDPTARPLAINVDYKDALKRCYVNVKEALRGKKTHDSLSALEGSYYESCYRYQRNQSENIYEDWAAYASRVTACSLLYEGNIKEVKPIFFAETETMQRKWWKLKNMEKETFLQIVTGEKSIDYFDTFVKKWYQEGGEKIIQEVKEKMTKTELDFIK